jgi:hypothetical protein
VCRQSVFSVVLRTFSIASFVALPTEAALNKPTSLLQISRRISIMSLRRWVAAFAALLISGVAIFSHAEGLSNSGSARSALFEPSDHAVQKDDSSLTVVEAATNGTPPVIDTATKKKKPPSFWDNKVFHPTKWFSSSKKNNRS